MSAHRTILSAGIGTLTRSNIDVGLVEKVSFLLADSGSIPSAISGGRKWLCIDRFNGGGGRVSFRVDFPKNEIVGFNEIKLAIVL